jgi:hypothetical protein
MDSRRLLGLAVLGILAIVIGLELKIFLLAPDEIGEAATTGTGHTHPGSASASDERAAAILARPLFAPSRQPPPVIATAEPSVQEATVASTFDMRLTGVVISGSTGTAIFMPSGGGKPVQAKVGTDLGGWLVRSIDHGAVVISGPDGERRLKPSLDPVASRAN